MDRDSSGQSPEQNKWAESRLLASVLLAAMVLLVFGQSLTFDFVGFDDPTYVSSNPRVLTGLTVDNATWAATTFYFSNYHPLTWWSYQLDASLMGTRPGGFHATNLLLHLINSLLLYSILRRVSEAPLRSLVVALLFAIHPLHVESVAWISERKDLLSILFGLLAIRTYLVHRGIDSWKTLFSVGGFLLLSLLSKQTLVTLPCLLLLLDVWPLKRLTWTSRRWFPQGDLRKCLVEKAPLLAIGLVFSLLIIWAQSIGGAMADGEKLPMTVRLGNAVLSYGIYLWQTVVPLNLSCYYPHPNGDLPWMSVAFSVIVLFGVTLACWRQRDRNPYLLVGWFWYLGTLLPMIGVIQVGTQAHADRYTYFPLIGIFIMMAWGAVDLVTGGHIPRRGAAYVAVTLCSLMAMAAFLQTQSWANTQVLAENALLVTPRNAVAHLLLSNLFIQENQLDVAEQHARAAVMLDPTRKEGPYNLGVVALRKHQLALAESSFLTAVELDPQYVKALRGLATVQIQSGHPEIAIDILNSTLEFDAGDPEVFYLKGVAHEQLGNTNLARDAYQQSLDIDPGHDAARIALRNLLSD